MVLKSRRQSLVSLGLLVALLGLLILPAIAQADNKPPEGYSYTVRLGDTWSNVSHRTGVSVAELKRLNPQAIHPKGWLWVGERLLVPGKPPTVAPPTVEPSKTESPKAVGYWYQVRTRRHLEHRRESYRCGRQATVGSEPRPEEPAAVALSGPAGMDPCCAAGYPGDSGGGFANCRGGDSGCASRHADR